MRTRSLLLVPAIVATTIALAGCSSLLSNTSENHFETYKGFSKSADLVFRKADWVPSDSTTLSTRAFNKKPGNMMSFTSTTGVTSTDCSAGALTGKPKLESNWWPADEPADGMVCGDWQVFQVDAKWYAWTN